MCHDAAGSMLGGENSEAAHCPQTIETRTQLARLIVSGKPDATISNEDGTMQLRIEETDALAYSDILLEAAQDDGWVDRGAA